MPLTLGLFDTHFPRFAVLPGVLILDGAVELATRYLAREMGGEWRLVEVLHVRWRHYIRPGDRMDVEVVESARAVDEAELSASIHVGRRLVATVRQLRFMRRG